MNTKELKKLKTGDEIFIRARFKKILCDGDVSFSLFVTSPFGGNAEAKGCTLPRNVILPSKLQRAPKYDPCRLFKRGDIVEPVERDGREVPDGAPVGEKCTVVESEKNGIVCIRYDAGSEHYIHEIPYFHLELVTPVEELEPYEVRHNEAHAAWSIYGPYNLSAVNYFYGERYPYTEATAKSAAESECTRLNAEYRKEKNND